MPTEIVGGGELNPIVIPNALPFDVGNSACLRNKKAIAVGRFVYEKGFDRLVDAWTNIYKMCPDWVLDVYGDGPLKPQIQAMINERGLSDVVKLHPACSNIQEKYHEASICLMTSRTEGFSMVLAEAQACGLPCIAYDVPSGPATIINNSVDGYLINDGNLVNFVNKAILLMNDSNARQTMGRKAQINALRFSEDSIMKMWTNVFDLNV